MQSKLLKFYNKYPALCRLGWVILSPVTIVLAISFLVLAFFYNILLMLAGPFYWIKTGGDILKTKANIFDY